MTAAIQATEMPFRSKMETNAAPFCWHAAAERAALLLAENDWADKRIAKECSISLAVLYAWKRHPAFAARVAEHVADLRQAGRRRAIAKRERRMARLNDSWERLQRVIEQRAADPEMANVPGGDTGLLVKTYKQLGGGKNARVVEEYRLDGELLGQLLAHEKQAAIECGQWSEKHELAVGAAPQRVSLDEFRLLPIAERLRLLRAPTLDGPALSDAEAPALIEAPAADPQADPLAPPSPSAGPTEGP